MLAGLRDGGWLDRQRFPPLRYAVPGLLPEGFSLLVGPPKAGKSWLALGILLALASGGRALDAIEIPRVGRVFYLALEDGHRRMRERCRALLPPDEPIPPLFQYLTAIRPGAAVATVEEFLALYPDTALVVIDTLGKVMPAATPGESSYQRDYRVGSELKAIADRRPGLALLVLHHDRKAAAEDFVDSVSATHGLAGSADSVIVVARRRNRPDGVLRVTGRDVPEGEYAAMFADGLWSLDGASLADARARLRERADAEGLGERAREILSFVGSHPDGAAGVTTKAITDKFGEVRVYLTRLVNSDPPRLERMARGRYRVPAVPSVPPVPDPRLFGGEDGEWYP